MRVCSGGGGFPSVVRPRMFISLLDSRRTTTMCELSECVTNEHYSKYNQQCPYRRYYFLSIDFSPRSVIISFACDRKRIAPRARARFFQSVFGENISLRRWKTHGV